MTGMSRMQLTQEIQHINDYRDETSGDVAQFSGVAYRIIDTCQLS